MRCNVCDGDEPVSEALMKEVWVKLDLGQMADELRARRIQEWAARLIEKKIRYEVDKEREACVRMARALAAVLDPGIAHSWRILDNVGAKAFMELQQSLMEYLARGKR